MRRTINISMSEEMHDYILTEARYGTISEYIRGLVRREQQRRADYGSRPRAGSVSANQCVVFMNALEQLDKLKAILERQDPYDL
jgi:Arc/MetJ-type ribon-helix-helix transcriptional regulator